MTELEKKIQAMATELLSTKKVDLVIGYEKGTAGISVRPAFISHAAQAKCLIYNPLCGHNLSVYLHRHKDKKLAIVAKPCDTRSLVGLIQERQIDRDSLTILAVSCEGVIDPAKLEKLAPAEKTRRLAIDNDQLIIETDDGQQNAPLKDLLSPGCCTCTITEPVICDQLLGTSNRQPCKTDEFAEVKSLAEKTPQQRWDDFCAEMSKCISCFACRNACPACYCTTCFVDASGPKWLGKTDDLSDVQIFHITRLVHMAGRCTGCGACLRACPMGVNLQKYTGKIRLDAREFFDFEAGDDPEVKPPLSTYSPSDPNDFFM
jgi:ferredoxin